nr:hypothetical protein [Tanacetum cinerariifolium]
MESSTIVSPIPTHKIHSSQIRSTRQRRLSMVYTKLPEPDAQTRFETAFKRSSDPPLSTGYTGRSKEDRMEQETDLMDFIPPTPYDSPLSGGHTPGSDEGRPKLLELMNICTKLSNRVLALEEAKTIQDKGSGEKGGSTADQVSTARPEVSAATLSTPPTTTTIFGDQDFTIAQTLIKMKSEKAKENEVAFRDVEEPPRLTRSTITLQPLPTIAPKDKDLAQRSYKEELAELDRAQKERQKQKEATIAALTEEFDEIQARMDADHELANTLKKTIGSRKSRGSKEQTTYKNSSQEHDDYLPQTYGLVMKRFEDNTPEEKRYPLIKEMLKKMLNWKLEAEAESTMAFELLKFIKSQIEE